MTTSEPLFSDVSAETLFRDEGTPDVLARAQAIAWRAHLLRLLPPAWSDAPDTAQALRSPQGMADFLLLQGAAAAREMAAGLAPRNAFWRAVLAEVERLSAA